MHYINPIEILELKNTDVSSFDSYLIKKSKRKLFADIELSDDGYLNYKGHELTKSDCIKAIDELENEDKIEFYSHLANNQPLNNFLANGSSELLSSFQQHSIYKLTAFVQFISPYFAAKLNRVLLKAFQNNNEELLSVALKSDQLLTKKDLHKAYKDVRKELNNRIQEVDKITKNINNEATDYTEENIDDVVDVVKSNISPALLNKLPDYFQSQLNNAAASINRLQLGIWNEFNTTSTPLKLLEHLLKLNITSANKPTFEKNYDIVKRKHQERIEQEKNAPILKKWAKTLVSIQTKVKKVEKEELDSNKACQFVNESVGISVLNQLPTFANEIRNQISYTLRNLSIACWNDQSDIKSALALIKLALKIETDKEVGQKIKQEKKELENIQKKYKGVLICHFCEENAPDEDSSIMRAIYKERNRSWLARRVEYSSAQVTIPRCKSCQEVHSEGVKKYRFMIFGGAIAGIALSALMTELYLLGGFIGTVIGWIAGNLMQSNLLKNEGTKDISDSTLENHPLLKERIKDGWSFSQPTA